MTLKCGDVGAREPDRHLDSDRHGVIGEHEALQFFVAQIIVADGGNDECGRAGGEVLLALRGEPLAVDKSGGRLRCPHARGEKIVRTEFRHCFEERREAAGEAGVFGALRQQRELRPMIRIFVNLAVIELDGANGLGRRCKPPPRIAKPRIGGEVAVFVDPGGERRGRDGEP